MAQRMLYFHLIAALITISAAFFLFRWKDRKSEIVPLVSGVLILFGLALTALFFPVEGFARAQLLVWVAFLYFPLFLLMGLFNFWNQNRYLVILFSVILLVTLLIGIDSFLIEPRWLKVTRLEIDSPKVEEPLKLAVLADIQTDAPGEYEREALKIVREENPDLILLVGDYVQIRDPEEYQRKVEELNQIFQEAGLSSPLGIYAVRGNVDWNSWSEIFQGLEVKTFEETETIDLGPLLLTGLDCVDSSDANFQVAGGDKFHLVMGHYPNYSLGEIKGDLLLAGHTHGGQIQLPGIGPLLTNSLVPRSWASGLTEIEPGKYLLVSNGIGLERGYAPEMRFLCRPEVIIMTLFPTP
jgi:predicted MPP superfamily phosphohydrolase